MLMCKVRCPICGNVVMKIDENAKLPLDVKCKVCNKLVVYFQGDVYAKELPERRYSSGLRFY